jgi:predicted SnoaL-like aldol condensation-catalyzing enzyme
MGDRNSSALRHRFIRSSDQLEEEDMSQTGTSRREAKDQRTDVPRLEEILSFEVASRGTAVADGNSHDDIRLRAYEIYVRRGQQPDCAMDDWLQAERERNKALVLQAFDTLFNKRDYAAAERFWSPNYIQHSSHIGPGREGLFNLIKSIPPTLKYEPGTIVAEGDYVIVHGRFSGFGQPVNWIAADIVRIKDDVLIEHWDVIQDEAGRQESKSGLPTFGDSFSK